MSDAPESDDLADGTLADGTEADTGDRFEQLQPVGGETVAEVLDDEERVRLEEDGRDTGE